MLRVLGRWLLLGRTVLQSLDSSQACLAGFPDAFGTMAAPTTEQGGVWGPGYIPSETLLWTLPWWLQRVGPSSFCWHAFVRCTLEGETALALPTCMVRLQRSNREPVGRCTEAHPGDLCRQVGRRAVGRPVSALPGAGRRGANGLASGPQTGLDKVRQCLAAVNRRLPPWTRPQWWPSGPASHQFLKRGTASVRPGLA